MSNAIHAIETVYNGHRFRSRLEARWAVFLDQAGIAYEFEPEGFDLGQAGRYLPDFYLPKKQMYMEVKAGYIDAAAVTGALVKLRALNRATQKCCLCVFGSPWPNAFVEWVATDIGASRLEPIALGAPYPLGVGKDIGPRASKAAQQARFEFGETPTAPMIEKPYQPIGESPRAEATIHYEGLYHVGDRIRHRDFGLGEITRIDPWEGDTALVIEFVGIPQAKRLLASFAPAVLVEIQPENDAGDGVDLRRCLFCREQTSLRFDWWQGNLPMCTDCAVNVGGAGLKFDERPCSDCGKSNRPLIWMLEEAAWKTDVSTNERLTEHLVCPGCYWRRRFTWKWMPDPKVLGAWYSPAPVAGAV